MARRPQVIIALSLALLSAVAGGWYYQWQNTRASSAATGELILAATFPGLDSGPQPLKAWRGKLLVVNFWATWCEPCREEIPGFIAIQREYAARNVQFVGIAIDQSERVKPYAQALAINYPILIGGLDVFDFLRRVGNRAGGLPYTVVVAPDGSVAEATLGLVAPAKLRNVLEKELAKQGEKRKIPGNGS